MSSPIPEEGSPIDGFATPTDMRRGSQLPSRVGSVVRIMEPERTYSEMEHRGNQRSLDYSMRSSSASARLMNTTPSSVRDQRARCPSQADLARSARRRGRRRRRPSSSLSESSIKSPYATSSLNWSSYNSPFAFRSPYSTNAPTPWSGSGTATPAFLKSPPSASGRATPRAGVTFEPIYPGRNRETGTFDLNATLMNMSLSSSVGGHQDRRGSYGRSLSRLSHATNGSTPSGIGQSRVSLELSGNISIELQTPRVDAPTPLEAAHPGKENLRRARLMSRLIVGLAQGSYPKLDQYFHKFDVDASYGKKLISQRSPTVFDIRMFVKNPMPSGYFEMIPTYQRNAPGGYVQYRMSKSLTVEDRSLMKDMWGPVLQEDAFLSPSVLHPWIAKGVKKAVKELQGIKIGRSTYGFLISVKPPEVVVIVRAISEATLVSSVFTLHILPAIMETGRPKISGFHLRMPLPPVLPYSRAGMNVMRQVEAEMEEGKLVWYLEGKHIEPSSKSAKSGYRRKDRHANCHHHGEGHDHDHDHGHGHGHGHGKEKKKGGSASKARDCKNWVISLESLEKRLLDLSLKTVPMAVARKGFSQFDTLVESTESLWSIMGKPQITSIKLWTIKRTALRNRTQQDWLRALLRILQETVDKKFGTYFLQPSINFLSETEQKALDSLSQAIKDLSEENAANETAPTPSLPKASTQRTQLVQTPRASKSKPHNPVAYSWG